MLNPDLSPSGRRPDGPRTITAPLTLSSTVDRRVVAGTTVSGANLLLAHHGAVGAWLASGRASIVTVERGMTLVQRGERVPYVYFPATAVLGVLSKVADGRHLQTLAIGREGSTAAVSLLDGGASISQVIVQMPGRVVRVDSGAVADEAAASPAFAAALRTHARRFFEQAQSVVACVNFHAVRGRVATWLLTNADRVDFAPMRVSHKSLSDILGVRRATISEILASFTRREIIECGRSVIRVLDAGGESGLRGECCSCYVPVDTHRAELAKLQVDSLTEVRRASAEAAAVPSVPADAVVANARSACAAALRRLTDRLVPAPSATAGPTEQAGSRDMTVLEKTVRAYVRVLRDSRHSPESTVSLVERAIDETSLSAQTRELLRTWALAWMLDTYYAAP